MSAPLNLQLDNPDLEVIDKYETVKAFQVLKQYLESEELSVDEAASQLYQMMPDYKTQIGAAEDDLGVVIMDIAEQIPYYHTLQLKLVELMKQLARSHRFNKICGDKKKLARYTALEALDAEMGDRCFLDWENDLEASRIINSCAFSARLAGAGTISRPMTPIIRSFRAALETHLSVIRGLDSLSVFVSVSSVWMLAGAGYYAYVNIVLNPPPVDALLQQAYQPHELYDGPIFGIQRWNFWQRALAERAQDGRLSEEARVLARKAADYMEALARDIQCCSSVSASSVKEVEIRVVFNL
ncbi:DUF3632 domain-containing protein [Aspergillus puulaauensis]|uniref:Uncharacterized protein n=1 Tax=Aspergillus puulaauensis TaxID=1220207 RepID=A0A7R8APX0_9EURO|nr:uncharacterized protein APUU_41474A [Aspergillus puulaauensis]BCS25030.1 hypothetical protein APUU_41474A [Aspergillus puulaauensis]